MNNAAHGGAVPSALKTASGDLGLAFDMPSVDMSPPAFDIGEAFHSAGAC
ncbi:hypothetical protein [Sandarakinorhabdus sp.]|nr:hypothetical protein [Sandarakinorhabdus sp.]